jgi:hypothetical protein
MYYFNKIIKQYNKCPGIYSEGELATLRTKELRKCPLEMVSPQGCGLGHSFYYDIG